MNDPRINPPGWTHDDEPAVRNAALADLVSSAKAQPLVAPSVTADAIVRLAAERRRAMLARYGLGAVGAAAAAALLAFGVGPRLAEVDRQVVSATAGTSHVSVTEGSVPGSSAAERGPESKQVEPATRARPEDQERGAVGPGASDGLAFADQDAWMIEPGHLRMGAESLRAEGSGLSVEFGDGRVLFVDGSVMLHPGGPGEPAVVVVSRGVAGWVGESPSEVTWIEERFGPQSEVGVAQGSTDKPSATALARRAESQLASGDRRGAVRTLRTLVSRHPRKAAARTGLVDLARLLKGMGRTDEARCAYDLYLERFPRGPLAVDVRRASERLGEGRGCRGLRPSK